MSQVAVAGLLTVLVSFLDVRNSEFLLETRRGAHVPCACPLQGPLGSQEQDHKLALFFQVHWACGRPHETLTSHTFDLAQKISR